jgi:hypothetical protein
MGGVLRRGHGSPLLRTTPSPGAPWRPVRWRRGVGPADRAPRRAPPYRGVRGVRGSTVEGAHTAHARPARFYARCPAASIEPRASQLKITYSGRRATLSRMTVRELLTRLQHLPRDLEVLAFEAGCEEYCEREVDELELQGGRVYLHLGARRDEPPRR